MSVAKKKISINKDECVACGSCLNVCPLSLISIYRGMYADANQQKCVGCGKCATACPASVICMVPLGGVQRETK